MTGLRVRFIGTGNAFQTDGRGAQSIWFETADQSFIVDVGPTALAGMEQSQLDPARLDGCFLTHLHGDHTAGWPFLLLHFAYISRRSRPFHLFGPAGTTARLEALAELCYPESLGPQERAYELMATELPVAEASALTTLPGIKLDTIPMDHDPSSIGYRFHLADRVVSVSGDTRWCAGLEDLARGSDFLIMECTTLSPSPAAHVSLAELRERADRLECERIVLVHLDDRVAGALRAEPLERVTVARDGLSVEL